MRIYVRRAKSLKINSLFQKSENPVTQSIATYRKVLIDDINLSLRLKYNDETYLTKPVEWIEHNITFEAPMKGLDYVILPKDTLLSVILVSKSALFHTMFRITKKYRKSNSLYYVAEIIAPIIKKQQREAFRLEVVLDVTYQLLSSDAAHRTSDKIQGKGTCLNISVGGMCLCCDHRFHAKEHIKLDFTLVETPLSFIGEVLFLGEQTESGSYNHRIRFLNIDMPKSNLLNQLIFEKQRHQLRYTTK